MCGRYAIYDIDGIGLRYDVEIPKELRPNYNAAPTQTLPVITQDGLKMMRWGLIPSWAKDEKIGYKLINARSETVLEKPMWKKPVMSQRCLIPANGFYEWKKMDDGKQPYFIHLKENELFTMAGIWEKWNHEGKDWLTYSILTTSPNKEMQNIHDRMPVILHPKTEMLWLGAENEDEITALLQPYDNNALEMHTVSKDVNKVQVNDRVLMGPINTR